MPSFVNVHLSVVSFHNNETFADAPRSTSIPEFSEGIVPWPISAFKVIILSPRFTVTVSTKVVCPDTVILPLTTRSLFTNKLLSVVKVFVCI